MNSELETTLLTGEDLRKAQDFDLDKVDLSPGCLERTAALVGLDPRLMWGMWTCAYPEELSQDLTISNIMTAYTLDHLRPGMLNALWKRFGIVNYTRYPMGMMVRQYDKIHDDTTPYGLAVFAMGDWSGNFYFRPHVYGELGFQLKDLAEVRFVEAAHIVDLVRRILRCNAIYGTNGNKISFVIGAGHANKWGMTLVTTRRDKLELTTDDLRYPYLKGKNKRHVISRVSEAIKPGAPVILDGCSLGRPLGLAYEISRLGFETTGSMRNWSNVDHFNPKVVNGDVRFNPVYTEYKRYATYRNGEQVFSGNYNPLV